MSTPHPTISAWERDEHDGFYEAELHDWKLRVQWTPNKADVRGSFRWEAERADDDDTKKSSEGSYEEMEHAMAEAELFAAADAERRTAKIAAKASRTSKDAD